MNFHLFKSNFQSDWFVINFHKYLRATAPTYCLKNGLLCLYSVLLFASCTNSNNSNTVTKSITGNASIIMGASSQTFLTPSATSLLAPADGNWNLSPNQAKITFTRVDFVNSSGSISATLNNCEVTYDREKVSGSNLLDCSFTLNISVEDGSTSSFRGEYGGIYIYYKRTLQLKIRDTTNNIYTDLGTATYLSTTEPAGGAAFVNYTMGGGSSEQDISSQIYLQTPFVVQEGETPSIKIVTDMNHTIMAQVSGGIPSFQTNSGQAPVQLMAVPSANSAGNEFYSNASTLDGFHQSGAGETYVRVFYIDNAPAFVVTNGYINGCADGNGISQAYAMNPATAPAQNAEGYKAGGYLGLSSGILAWAFPTSWLWTQYSGIYKLEKKTTIGSSAQFECAATSTVPAPSSGNTYESGPPTFTPITTLTLSLLAK